MGVGGVGGVGGAGGAGGVGGAGAGRGRGRAAAADDGHAALARHGPAAEGAELAAQHRVRELVASRASGERSESYKLHNSHGTD